MAVATITAEPETISMTALSPRYKVLMHDDDVTTMDFVVDILRRIFAKSAGEAATIMMEVHNSGVALVEVVPLEEAELHVDQCHSLARTRKFPLALTIEYAD